jgi:hypothetical protein
MRLIGWQIAQRLRLDEEILRRATKSRMTPLQSSQTVSGDAVPSPQTAHGRGLIRSLLK